ncbi:hypothetical protein [Evansella clarkii]|uniref:hypothetical protein n=1 Tax=Evansella clarkii TaxID=79879 RepID=UPI00099814EA|nr:hypothetical protein [Evansella clarkii]
MTIGELYDEAVKGGHSGLVYLLEWLVYEQGVGMERDARNVEYILEKYGESLNHPVGEYKKRQDFYL